MNHYRIALALTLALVLLVVGFFLYLGGIARFPSGAVTLSSLPFVVLLGLWLQSYFLRYCGGVLFLVLGGFFIWQTYSQLRTDISAPRIILVYLGRTLSF